jgi:hypothetical protein
MISDPRIAKYILSSPLFNHGAPQEKTTNLLFGYGSVLLAHGTLPNNSLVLLLKKAQVTDTESFAIP